MLNIVILELYPTVLLLACSYGDHLMQNQQIINTAMVYIMNEPTSQRHPVPLGGPYFHKWAHSCQGGHPL